MTFKFNNNGEILNVFVRSNEFATSVIVENSKNGKDYERTIREDTDGKFFTWNKHKFYLNDFMPIHMAELKTKVDAGEWITSDEICQAILTEGVDNVRFSVPLNLVSASICGSTLLDGDKEENVECKVVESYNRKVSTNYKLDLVPVTPSDRYANHRDWYTTDFVSAIRQGYIKILPCA